MIALRSGWFGKGVLGVMAAVGMFVSAAAYADDLHLLINGKAFHVNAPAGSNYNENNWGGGLQYDFVSPNAKWMPFLQVSGFKDSMRNMSYYAGGGVLRHLRPGARPGELRADVGIVAFVMTRKDYKDDKPFIGALPAFSVGTDRAALNVTYIPKVDPKMVALWFVQLKVRIAEIQ